MLNPGRSPNLVSMAGTVAPNNTWVKETLIQLLMTVQGRRQVLEFGGGGLSRNLKSLLV